MLGNTNLQLSKSMFLTLFFLLPTGVHNITKALAGQREAIEAMGGVAVGEPLPVYAIKHLEENQALYGKASQNGEESSHGCVILKCRQYIVFVAYEKDEEIAINKAQEIANIIQEKFK